MRVFVARLRLEHGNVGRIHALQAGATKRILTEDHAKVNVHVRVVTSTHTVQRSRTSTIGRKSVVGQNNAAFLDLTNFVFRNRSVGAIGFHRKERVHFTEVSFLSNVAEVDEARSNRLGSDIRASRNTLGDLGSTVHLQLRNRSANISQSDRGVDRTTTGAVSVNHVRTVRHSVPQDQFLDGTGLLTKDFRHLVQNRVFVRVFNYIGKGHPIAVLRQGDVHDFIFVHLRSLGHTFSEGGCRDSQRDCTLPLDGLTLVLRDRLVGSVLLKEQFVLSVGKELANDVYTYATSDVAVLISTESHCLFLLNCVIGKCV